MKLMLYLFLLAFYPSFEVIGYLVSSYPLGKHGYISTNSTNSAVYFDPNDFKSDKEIDLIITVKNSDLTEDYMFYTQNYQIVEYLSSSELSLHQSYYYNTYDKESNEAIYYYKIPKLTDRYLYATFPLYKQIPGSSIKINVKKGLSTGAIAGIVIGIIVFIIILSIVIVYFIKRKKKKINIIPVNIDIDKEKEPKEVYNISEPLTIENLSEYSSYDTPADSNN